MKFGSWTYNGFKVGNNLVWKILHFLLFIFSQLTNTWFLLLQLDFQLAADAGDTASFIPNGEWALMGE